MTSMRRSRSRISIGVAPPHHDEIVTYTTANASVDSVTLGMHKLTWRAPIGDGAGKLPAGSCDLVKYPSVTFDQAGMGSALSEAQLATLHKLILTLHDPRQVAHTQPEDPQGASRGGRM